MAGSAAAPGWFNVQGMWEGSIASYDGDIRRRPYHRNCGCALHRSRAISSDSACSSSSSVSYPIRRRSSSWHSLTASFSAGNLAGADANTRDSFEGCGSVGGGIVVEFMIDAEE